MEITQAKIAEYTAVLKEQKTAENTIVSYERDLCRMADYLMSFYGVEGVHATHTQLQSYLYQMEAEKSVLPRLPGQPLRSRRFSDI